MSVNSKMTAIADAIRSKTKKTGTLTLDQMATDIAGIDTSKPEQTKTATPSLSQQTISPDSGKVLSGVTVNPITSSLLTSLDSDFKAANIAEGVNMFGVVGAFAGGGAKMATGTVTAVNSGSTESGTDTITVTGLDFTPAHVICVSLSTDNAATLIRAIYDTLYVYGTGSGSSRSTIELTLGGFTFGKTKAFLSKTHLSGDYVWIAWAE